jgi:gamma-glutamylcyclotransferase (GGCT)/AIG2-like uncharacterized protein YtfP
MKSLKSIYRELEGQCLDPSLVYGCEVDGEVYEFEGDSLSQVDCIESINEIESLADETFEMEIKHVVGGYVLLKNYNVVERGTYEECNATLNDYVEIYEWINEMSNKLNQ